MKPVMVASNLGYWSIIDNNIRCYITSKYDCAQAKAARATKLLSYLK